MAKMSEAKFAELVQDRLITTEEVVELVGLTTTQGVRHRVEHGWYSGPVIVKKQAISLWDREQVERQEAKRVKDLEVRARAAAAAHRPFAGRA